MADGPSLVNLGDLSKPATALIDKISEAIGGAFRPHQIRRVARAEADAQLIAAATQLEISELQHRALRRFVSEEARKQDNIEAITEKALRNVTDNAEPNKIEDDWITNFFDKCRVISDEEMQILWAQVLAGQANAPGWYSKRTVDYLASLDKNDAHLFRTLCGFGWNASTIIPLVFDVSDAIYTTSGLTFTALTHLDDIGLVRFESVSGFRLEKLPKQTRLAYYGGLVELELPASENNYLNIGHVLLSKVGQELAPLCASTAVDGFLDYVVGKWRTENIRVSPIGPHVTPVSAP